MIAAFWALYKVPESAAVPKYSLPLALKRASILSDEAPLPGVEVGAAEEVVEEAVDLLVEPVVVGVTVVASVDEVEATVGFEDVEDVVDTEDVAPDWLEDTVVGIPTDERVDEGRCPPQGRATMPIGPSRKARVEGFILELGSLYS